MEQSIVTIYCRVRQNGMSWDVSFSGLVDGNEDLEMFGGGDHDLHDLADCDGGTIQDAIIEYCEEYELNYSLKLMKERSVEMCLFFK